MTVDSTLRKYTQDFKRAAGPSGWKSKIETPVRILALLLFMHVGNGIHVGLCLRKRRVVRSLAPSLRLLHIGIVLLTSYLITGAGKIGRRPILK